MRLYIITCLVACIVVHLEAVPISYKDVDPKDADADERKQLLNSLTKEFEKRYSSKHFVKDAKEVQKTLQGLEGKVDDEEEGYTKRNAKSQRWMSRTFMWEDRFMIVVVWKEFVCVCVCFSLTLTL